jgi:hypothetical protein
MMEQMKSSRWGKKVILVSFSLVIVLIIWGIISLQSWDVDDVDFPASPTFSATSISSKDRNLVTPSVIPAPGLIIYGKVTDQNGYGVANVLIYRNYASYAGEVIATTDANGYYESGFFGIPGDEMIGVWAESPGLVFEPQYYRWRHYFGSERKECDFLAKLP